MAVFRFSLQQVLDYRVQLEDQAKVRLGKAQAELMAAERRLQELRDMLTQAELALYNADPNSEDRWLQEQYAKGLRQDIAYTSKLLTELNQAVEAARADLIIKAKERKVLDKFKEKQAKRHAQDERLQEQRNYDEIASIRFKATPF